MGSAVVARGLLSAGSVVVAHDPVAPRHVGSSRTRAQTRVPCIGRRILNHCTTMEVPLCSSLISLFPSCYKYCKYCKLANIIGFHEYILNLMVLITTMPTLLVHRFKPPLFFCLVPIATTSLLFTSFFMTVLFSHFGQCLLVSFHLRLSFLKHLIICHFRVNFLFFFHFFSRFIPLFISPIFVVVVHFHS